MHQVSEKMELIEAIETLFARADKVSSIFTFSFMKGAVHKRRRKLGGGGVKFHRNRSKKTTEMEEGGVKRLEDSADVFYGWTQMT